MLSLAAYANPRPNPHHNPTATLPLKPHCESQTCLHLVPISVAASSQSCVNLAHTHTHAPCLRNNQQARRLHSFLVCDDSDPVTMTTTPPMAYSRVHSARFPKCICVKLLCVSEQVSACTASASCLCDVILTGAHTGGIRRTRDIQ